MRIVIALIAFVVLAASASAQERSKIRGWLDQKIAAERRGDERKAYELTLLIAANTRDPYWRAVVGDHHWLGRGVAPDPAQAVMWYRSAARDGEPLAEARLAEAHFRGRGVERSIDATTYWLERAARGRIAIAHFELALHHYRGTSASANPDRAAYYLEQGIDLSAWSAARDTFDAEARTRPLGVAYVRAGDAFACPRAAPADLGLATQFWLKSAAEGYSRGWSRLRILARHALLRVPLCRH